MTRFNGTSTLVGHFVSSPTKRDEIDIKSQQKRRKRWRIVKDKVNDSPETEEILTWPLPQPVAIQQALTITISRKFISCAVLKTS